jgi:hypothetical protein
MMVNGLNEEGEFHSVISLHNQKLSWNKAYEMSPALPKGWWELSQLKEGVALEFTHDFWVNHLPYLPHIYHFLDSFFSKIKEIEVVLIQKEGKGLFRPFIVYKLQNRIYFGAPPIVEKEAERLKRAIEFPLPEDFFSFLEIHDGFFKKGDTGVFPSYALSRENMQFQHMQQGLKLKGKPIDPHLLFPFYRSFGLDVYQCFYKDWYPDGEMGNVLCSLSEQIVSSWTEEQTLAFSSFLDWLIFYLE